MTAWLLKTAIVALYLAATAVAGLWLLLPWYTPVVFLLVLGVVAPWQFWRRRALPWRAGRLSWIARGVRGALAALAVTVLIAAFDGRRLPPERAVDLAFPLSEGTYYITGGGDAELINPHLQTLTADRFRAYRGQSYGVDIVELGALGMRASGLAPRDPRRYAIFSDLAHAPCSGVVVRAEDGFRDMPPPETDRSHMAGNHVLVDCGGVHVLLAHLQRGSVTVRTHQDVTIGTVVGRVGNSGNTGEPHLHVHAQRPARNPHDLLSGDPLPIRLDGRFLVRNDLVTSRPAAP